MLLSFEWDAFHSSMTQVIILLTKSATKKIHNVKSLLKANIHMPYPWTLVLFSVNCINLGGITDSHFTQGKKNTPSLLNNSVSAASFTWKNRMIYSRLSGANGIKTFLFHLSYFNGFVRLVCSWVLYCWRDLDLWQQGWQCRLCHVDESTGQS